FLATARRYPAAGGGYLTWRLTNRGPGPNAIQFATELLPACTRIQCPEKAIADYWSKWPELFASMLLFKKTPLESPRSGRHTVPQPAETFPRKPAPCFSLHRF